MRFSERSDPKAARLGVALTLAKYEIFALWHRVRDGTLARSTFQRRMAPLRQRIFDLLDDGANAAWCDKTRRTCERLLKHFRSLWTFVAHDGIEPTNNVAEQAIRCAVILRKTSFGSQSDHGCRFLERVLTVHATLRKRGAIVHDFIVAACRAHMLGSRGPSLLGA